MKTCFCCERDVIGKGTFCEVCVMCGCRRNTVECREVVVSDSHGIYVPKVFAERYRDIIEGVREEDWLTLLDGPMAEFYWEAWMNVLDDAKHKDVKRNRLYTFTQDGDVFMHCQGAIE